MPYFLCLLLLLYAEICSANELSITLHPADARLDGVLSLERPEPLPLHLDENCSIASIQQVGRILNFTLKAGELYFSNDRSAPVSISYECRFSDRLSELPAHNEDPSYGINASISEIGTYLSPGIYWYPRRPGDAEPLRLRIQAPAGISAVTSGKRLSQSNAEAASRSEWLIERPAAGVPLAAGPYQIFEDLQGGIPIYAYFTAATAHLAPTYLREARNYLNFYAELFGPYPFAKFAIVENFFPTGYGFPSWTLLGSSVIQLPFIVKTSLGHEIAHSWWGNGIRVDYSQGNWAEGLTTYLADYLYAERESAAEAREYRLKILRDYASLVGADQEIPLNRFLSRSDKASQAIGYGKGAMFFHMLREKIGDEPFFGGLKHVTGQHMFQTLDWYGFVAVFSASSGENLQPFFDQWLKRKGGPTLTLSEISSRQMESGWELSGVLKQQQPVYTVAIELQLETVVGRETATLRSDSVATRFQFFTAARPIALHADPNADLFRILAPEEIPSTINSIRGSKQLLIIHAEEGAPTSEAQQVLLGALRKENFPIVAATDLSAEQLAAHDLLIFGSSERLRAPDVDTTPTAGQARFVVKRNPWNPQRHAAWFTSAAGETAATVARKIPHYGKYSELRFEGETNVLKRIVETDEGPLQVRITPDSQ